jgi:hypothetical protein
MKLGILFNGVSYGFSRNCFHCFQNQKQFLIDPFKNNNDVKIYLSSYTSDRTSDIINLYLPTLYNFSNIDGSHQILTYIKGLELIKNQNLDFVISTRFDIHFNQIIANINFDYNKFNALFKERGWWDNMKFTTDNMFAFPYNMLDDFISVLHELYQNPSRLGQTDMHQAFYRVKNRIGESNTHIVSPIDELSNTNLFYSLCSDKWGIK